MHTEPHEKNFLSTVRFAGGSIVLWGCMASTSATLLKGDGRANPSQYQLVLNKNVKESVAKVKLCRVWVFQQDIDTKHCLESIK